MRPLLLALSAAGVLASAAGAQSITMKSGSVRLFAQDGGNVLGEGKRVYTNYFNTLRTQYIGVEVSLEYGAAATGFTLSVGCQMTQPDGKVVDGIWRIGVRIGEGSTQATGANTLFGAGREGWQTGLYKVACSASRPVGETTFQMSPGPSLLNDLELRLKDVRFFPTGSKLTPVAERKYLDRFSSAEATMIGVELSFVHPAPGKAAEVPIDCYYLTPSGSLLGSTLSFTYSIEPNATSGTAALGQGWDQPGKWKTGDYLAICQMHGRPIAVSRFTVW